MLFCAFDCTTMCGLYLHAFREVGHVYDCRTDVPAGMPLYCPSELTLSLTMLSFWYFYNVLEPESISSSALQITKLTSEE